MCDPLVPVSCVAWVNWEGSGSGRGRLVGKIGRWGSGRYRRKFLSGTFILDITFGLVLVRDMNAKGEAQRWLDILIPLVLAWEILPHHTR